MTESDVLERLTKIFRTVFEDDSIVARMEMKASDVKRWDSLSHVDMILLVEEEFGIRMSARELGALNNVGDLVRVILAKTA
jgi:acyl carrier protein